MTKLEAVNAVLQEFAPDTWVEHVPGKGWIVKWKRRDRVISRRWQTMQGTDDYPSWERHWGHGGTSCRALSQLIRWLQGRSVLPLGTWKYWTGETVKLGTPKVVEILKSAGYPEQVKCVLCGELISGGLDWWRTKKLSGACHAFGVCKEQRSLNCV